MNTLLSPVKFSQWPTATLCVVLALMLGTVTPAADEPRALRHGTELFVDDSQIARQSGTTRRIHAADKWPEPVLVADQPWEGGDSVRIYGTTLYDEKSGEFRMWYSQLYATSRDGIHWTKPKLDLFPSKGQPTNRVLPKGGGAVIFDPTDPDPAKRYKALANETIKVGGFSGYHSPDGIHWTRYGEKPVISVGSELGHLMHDPATGKYFAYIRPFSPKYFPASNRQKRLGGVVTSADFIHWSEMKVVLEPDEIDDAWVTRPDQRTEFYAMNGFAYGNSYLGIVPLFRITDILETKKPGQSKYDGPMEGQLITSRDGLQWQRLADRSPVIPSGTTYDRSIMNVAIAPILVKDEVWHYYTAINATHGAPRPPKRITIALARWRLDGWVSLDAGAKEAVVETVPIVDRTGSLEINANAAKGRLVVEVLDADGHPLPGYSAAECQALTADEVRHTVRWANHETPPMSGPFKLRFRFQDASLFSYTLR